MSRSPHLIEQTGVLTFLQASGSIVQASDRLEKAVVRAIVVRSDFCVTSFRGSRHAALSGVRSTRH
ncbi:hypothetical protein QUA35_12165 [Microcoleus sp. N9_B2]|uniref:hypothetical protein n=1 Tax=unclassified Microcoleus TaxID=2642155 RepID=UPI002FD1075E